MSNYTNSVTSFHASQGFPSMHGLGSSSRTINTSQQGWRFFRFLFYFLVILLLRLASLIRAVSQDDNHSLLWQPESENENLQYHVIVVGELNSIRRTRKKGDNISRVCGINR